MITIYSSKHSLRNAKTELYGGELVRPFERPERMDYIIDEIKNQNLGEIKKPKEIDFGIINKIHDEDYINFLNVAWDEWIKEGFKGEAIPNIWPSRSMDSKVIPKFIEGKLGYYSLAGETSISDGSIEAAYEAVKVVITASEMLQNNNISNIFSLCRPPGHHASKNQFGGYCFFNNAAIAAEYFKINGANKIFILDVDFHHGNGTQSIFYNRSDVFYASLHGDPMYAFPHFLGHADEKGTGPGEGYNKNYPMPPGTSYDVWSEALDDSIKNIKTFNPEMLIVSLGVDVYENDPISFFKLKCENFIDIGKRLSKLKLPTLFVMEGGYAIKDIGVNTVNTLKGFENR